jgi:hypothetical protein
MNGLSLNSLGLGVINIVNILFKSKDIGHAFLRELEKLEKSNPS